jgi:hypothetical protein
MNLCNLAGGVPRSSGLFYVMSTGPATIEVLIVFFENKAKGIRGEADK